VVKDWGLGVMAEGRGPLVWGLGFLPRVPLGGLPEGRTHAFGDRLRVGGTSLAGVPPEQKMRKRHLPRVIYHQVY